MEPPHHPSTPIRQTIALGAQWPTIDPFLFCAHHLDNYPASDGNLGPSESLEGRNIGQDFDGINGWNMYHGATVPGFPQHPHRGFETVTYIRRGYCDHADSLGAKARFGEGDVQWLTAGSGIVHSEMFPLLDDQNPNPLQLFQIWLNLPASKKMVDPYFSMYWNDDVPKHSETDSNGRSMTATVLTGTLGGKDASPPPPDSWASQDGSDVQIWHIKLDADATWSMPQGPETSNRVLYFFEGDQLLVAGETISVNTGVVLDPSRPVELEADSSGSECIVLQGRPIGEPVAQYGPFVMNTETEIQQAMLDYRRTQFGGWPWKKYGPTHGDERTRFVEMLNPEH